jgi:hypothetical protein
MRLNLEVAHSRQMGALMMCLQALGINHVIHASQRYVVYIICTYYGELPSLVLRSEMRSVTVNEIRDSCRETEPRSYIWQGREKPFPLSNS